VVSVAGVPLEARRVYGQFQGPEAQGPPGALTVPWWQVKPPLAPGGPRGTALGPPFHSARAQRGATKTRRCPSPATATPRSTARRQPQLTTQVGGLGPCFTPTPTPHRPRRLKQIDPPPVPPGKTLLHPGTTMATWAAHHAHCAHNRTALAHHRRACGTGGGGTGRHWVAPTRGIREVP
jgi:hypothetical protein